MRAQRAKQREELKLVADNPELAKEMHLYRDTKQYNSLKFDLESEEDDKYMAMEKGTKNFNDFTCLESKKVCIFLSWMSNELMNMFGSKWFTIQKLFNLNYFFKRKRLFVNYTMK